MVTSRLQRDLPLYNRWWRSDEPPTEDGTPYRETRRSDYENHLQGARDDRFYALIGANGSGKTTTLYQIVHDLIAHDQVPPEHIVYVPLENPLYPLESDRFLLDVHEWYKSYVRRRVSTEDSSTYFLFDDIHWVDGWVEQVQDLLDRDSSAHVVITLPTGIPAVNDFRESNYAAGNSILLPPKFYDFSRFVAEVPAADKGDYVYPLRKALGNDRAVDLPTVVDEYLTLHDRLDVDGVDFPSLVDDYLHNSGLRPTDDQGLSAIKQTLELAVYRDVRRFHQIEHPGDLYTLCVLVAQEPVREFRFSKLTDQLNTDRRTIRKYLNILEEFFILSPSYKWDYERHRGLRMYLRDPQFVSALTLLSDGDAAPTTDEHRRKLIHSVAYDHLRRLSFYLNDYTDTPVTYWDEAGETVEYVLDANGKPVPVALTTRRGEDTATSAMHACLDATDAPHGVVAGQDIRQPFINNDGILRLPLWMLLYTC